MANGLGRSALPELQKTGSANLPGVVLEISTEAKEAFKNSERTGETQAGKANETQGCETCNSRKYVDVSSDPSVSFQSPAHISPSQSASKVMAHEREHISNDQAKAHREDRKVISQTVTLSMSTCPECNKIYVSGGTARTLTAKTSTNDDPARELNITKE